MSDLLQTNLLMNTILQKLAANPGLSQPTTGLPATTTAAQTAASPTDTSIRSTNSTPAVTQQADAFTDDGNGWNTLFNINFIEFLSNNLSQFNDGKGEDINPEQMQKAIETFNHLPSRKGKDVIRWNEQHYDQLASVKENQIFSEGTVNLEDIRTYRDNVKHRDAHAEQYLADHWKDYAGDDDILSADEYLSAMKDAQHDIPGVDFGFTGSTSTANSALQEMYKLAGNWNVNPLNNIPLIGGLFSGNGWFSGDNKFTKDDLDDYLNTIPSQFRQLAYE